MVHAEQSEEFNNVENILVIVFNAYFEVPYHGKDHNDYVNGAGFCCEGKDKKLQAYGGGIGKGNEEYEKMQYYKNVYDYYLTLRTGGSTPYYGEGVYILLKNGKKIIKNNISNDIDVNSYKKYSFEGDYNISAIIPLNHNDIYLLSNSEVDSFKIYIYEEFLLDKESELFLQQTKCLKSAK